MTVLFRDLKEIQGMFALYLFFFILFFIAPACAYKAEANDSSYLTRLIESAHRQKLHEQRYWNILLHYKNTLSGFKSLVDDPKFFLSPKGKTDPQSELEATIKAFFRENTENPDDHPICRFIARYTWLREKLKIDPSKLPVSECKKFTRVIKEVKPKSATLVFPTYYMNSPASMFGHTLISIGTADYKSKLLSHAVNYSAQTNETNGLLFAFRGLFGFYKGYYSILPYYQKIQEYSDIRQRDIWEYPLNLTEQEVEKLVMHLWEIQNLYAYYYFFDENCSYNLLFLLEAARPSAKLTDQFSLWALPIDTLKAAKNQGLIDSVEYRPSKATKIKHKFSLLNKESQQIALDIINGDTVPKNIASHEIQKDEHIKILDFSTGYTQYQYARKKLSKSEYQNILIDALKVRSKLGKSAEELPDIMPPPRPDEIHESERFSLGLGIRKNRFFQEIGYRPVFSDLTDTDYVYNQGTQIQFGDTKLRYYDSDKKLVLEKLGIIDIISIAPRDRLFKPYSWKIITGLNRKFVKDDDEPLVYTLNTGAGISFHHDYPGLFYTFLEPELNIGGSLEHSYSLGLGFSAGLLKNITPWWKCHLSARKMYFESGDKHRPFEISLTQNIGITRNSRINWEISWEKVAGYDQAETILSWCIFF
ncbi:MAG: DUF4105 domain-containing protein [Desulfobacterales bacterium]|nr:DUF4105 domain-containing protein [Desulfobacterales bacterium]